MTNPTFRAAKTICELSGWKMSNLPLQKLLYLAHMFHLGRNNVPLVHGNFEAWDLGPVHPELYRKVKAYGSSPVANVFIDSAYTQPDPQYASIKEVYDTLNSASPGRLVQITHEDGGAWASCYRPNIRGIVIPNESIRAEYERRADRAAKRNKQ